MLENTLFVTHTNFYRLWAAELEGITPELKGVGFGRRSLIFIVCPKRHDCIERDPKADIHQPCKRVDYD